MAQEKLVKSRRKKGCKGNVMERSDKGEKNCIKRNSNTRSISDQTTRDGADVGIGVFELINILLPPPLVRFSVHRNSASLQKAMGAKPLTSA
jgi:hypothetical protein